MNNIIVSKEKGRIVVIDRKSGKRIFRVKEQSVIRSFNLDKSFLSGVGSIMNIPGNYRSYQKYLSSNDDNSAIENDWRQVGEAMWEAISFFK